jgi:proline dehydrogenase
MSVMRSLLLAAAQNEWLRERAVKHKFVRRTVSRFMPGESLPEALGAAEKLRKKKIGAVLTRLGENVKDRSEALQVTEHYIEVLDQMRQNHPGAEISVKLTQLGLDLSPEFCYENLLKIVEHAENASTVWVDMEASSYVDATLDIYSRSLGVHPHVGICLQAYLHRTREDLARLLALRPSIRLVKGAYDEPPEIAFARKQDVDENYFVLAQEMLRARASDRCARAAFGTHDLHLIQRILEFGRGAGFAEAAVEVQMLYGIQRSAQERLANEGCRTMVLVAYGSYWYPWFVRRLAERPANLWFMVKNVFAG